MRTRRPVRLAAALLALLATTACVGLPDTGPVVPAGDEVRTQPDADVERRAQPPQEGQPPQVVVTAFLQAMTAYPVRTDVARQFLASDARAGWDPSRIIIYDGRGSTTGSGVVKVDLLGTHWVDSHGVWRGQRDSGDIRLKFPMVEEDDAWRIAVAPNALIVPDDWFQDRYQAASLYFLDPTARILVPEPVFVPDRPGGRGAGPRPPRRSAPVARRRHPVVRATGPDPGPVRAGGRRRRRERHAGR